MIHYCGQSNFSQCCASVSASVIAPLARKTRFLACKYFKVNCVLIYCHIAQCQNICSRLGSNNITHLRLPMEQLGQLFLQSPDAGVVWRPLRHKNHNQSSVTTGSDPSAFEKTFQGCVADFRKWENQFFQCTEALNVSPAQKHPFTADSERITWNLKQQLLEGSIASK